MAITFSQLQDLLKHEGLRFYISPEQPILRLGISGLFGQYEVMIILQDDGQFLQFRTVNFLSCPPDHKHFASVMKTLAAINSQKRFLKCGWDPADGEIMIYADVWVMDNQVTQAQFTRMTGNFLPGIDAAYPRIMIALETGNDPGNQDPRDLLAQAAGGGLALPPHLRELFEKLQKKAASSTPPPPAGDKPEVKEI